MQATTPDNCFEDETINFENPSFITFFHQKIFHIVFTFSYQGDNLSNQDQYVINQLTQKLQKVAINSNIPFPIIVLWTPFRSTIKEYVRCTLDSNNIFKLPDFSNNLNYFEMAMHRNFINSTIQEIYQEAIEEYQTANFFFNMNTETEYSQKFPLFE